MGTSPKAAADTARILNSIRKLVQGLQKVSKGCERDIDLSSAQFFVLELLSDGKPRSIGELADATFTHQSLVSLVVGRLADGGWVERGASASDRWRTEVRITRRGLDLASRSTHFPQESMLRALAGFAGEDFARSAVSFEEFVERSDFQMETPSFLFESESAAKNDDGQGGSTSPSG